MYLCKMFTVWLRFNYEEPELAASNPFWTPISGPHEYEKAIETAESLEKNPGTHSLRDGTIAVLSIDTAPIAARTRQPEEETKQ